MSLDGRKKDPRVIQRWICLRERNATTYIAFLSLSWESVTFIKIEGK